MLWIFLVESVVGRCEKGESVCRSRDNVIVLGGQGRAGMSDRKAIFAHYGLLADALCAVFEVPPPSEMLSAKHNDNQTVSQQRWWDDYFSAFNGDGGLLLQRISPSSSTLETVERGGRSLLEQFREAANASRPFLWFLESYYFAHGTPHHAPELWETVHAILDKCPEEIRFEDSKRVEDLAFDFRLRYKRFATVHVRRGDNVERCNSSVSLVARKVECEGFLRSSREKEEDYLVIFSDESDSSYMSALIDQLSSSSNDRSTVVWGDEVVRSLLRLRDSSFWDDNYMVYETSLYLRHQISEKDLDIGRHKHCTKC